MVIKISKKRDDHSGPGMASEARQRLIREALHAPEHLAKIAQNAREAHFRATINNIRISIDISARAGNTGTTFLEGREYQLEHQDELVAGLRALGYAVELRETCGSREMYVSWELQVYEAE